MWDLIRGNVKYRRLRLKDIFYGGQSPPAVLQGLYTDPGGTDDDDPGGTGVGANVGGASTAAAVAAVSSLSASTTSSSRVPLLNANEMFSGTPTER